MGALDILTHNMWRVAPSRQVPKARRFRHLHRQIVDKKHKNETIVPECFQSGLTHGLVWDSSLRHASARLAWTSSG